MNNDPIIQLVDVKKNYGSQSVLQGVTLSILEGKTTVIVGGSGQGNLGGVETEPIPLHGRPQSLSLNLPPLAAIFLKSDNPSE